MKIKSFVYILFFLININLYSQKLSLSNLETICNKKSWENVNQYLLRLNWEYSDSQKGSSTEYNTIIWSFNKEFYSDKAQAWFYLYTYEGFPNKIIYSVFNKPAYMLIQNSLKAKGYKLSDREIKDSEIITSYSNQRFILKITTLKTNSSDNFNTSITAYSITLIKKAGAYDENNGEKFSYNIDGSIEVKYNLKNGKLNGYYETYYPSGKIKMTGYYKSGEKNGLFKDYYEDGSIQFKYNIKIGKLNGYFESFFLNGNKKKTGYFKNGNGNGLFKEYNENGVLNSEYNMLNGVMNGSFKFYYDNGVLFKTGNFINGIQNGNFKEYSENGNLETTYSMLDNEYDGLITIYKDGKIDEKLNYSKGIKDGSYVGFAYDNNDSLTMEYTGFYKKGLKNGLWSLFVYKNKKKELASFTNYINDIKNGEFKEIQGDSLIFGSYKNDKLDGNYIVYIDFSRAFFGTAIILDSTKLKIQTKGKYFQNKKYGKWTYYYSGTKIREGNYRNDLKEGVWKYYYTKYFDLMGNIEKYSGKLYLTKTYKSNKLNGKSERFSELKEMKVLCDTNLNRNSNPLDTCTKDVWIKMYQSVYYKNDILYGPYIYKDSLGKIRFKGNYINGKKDGIWIDSYLMESNNNTKAIVYQEGNYINDIRDGKWIEYFSEGSKQKDFNYTAGKLNGDYFIYNRDNDSIKKLLFAYDKLKSVSIYDSLGKYIIIKYIIIKSTNSYFKVRRIDYGLDYTYSLEYFIEHGEIDKYYDFFKLIFALKTKDYKEGYPDGEYKIIDKNGNILLLGKMLKDLHLGLWIYNYPSQNVQIQVEFTNNEPGIEKYVTLDENELFSGTFIFYDNENNQIQKRKIKNGFRNGTTLYLDENNKKIKKIKYKKGIIK